MAAILLIVLAAIGGASVLASVTGARTPRDCPQCPEMVVIPAGEFTMGSPESEQGSDADEWPARRISLRRPFALGKYEVTRGQYAAFMDATGRGQGPCWVWDEAAEEAKPDARYDWRAPGFSQGDADPVVCVSHADAKAYAVWLSGRTGRAYRLPSEAEWEYAARAGTRTARYWGEGEEQACTYANVADRSAKVGHEGGAVHPCRDGFATTAPVGSFEANAFGLHDMLGNVWEWVEDCWNEGYAEAPSDASAWTTGDCAKRVLRGGSWSSAPRSARGRPHQAR